MAMGGICARRKPVSSPIEYVVKCSFCDGTGCVGGRSGVDPGPCAECNGHGEFLTEEGDRLLKFIQSYIFERKDLRVVKLEGPKHKAITGEVDCDIPF